MKKIFLISMLVLFMLLSSQLAARVVYQGTLQLVFPELNSVIIDNVRYDLIDNAQIYGGPSSDTLLPFDRSLEGKRVIYDLNLHDEQRPRIKYMIIQD